jgi:hypothetical protein
LELLSGSETVNLLSSVKALERTLETIKTKCGYGHGGARLVEENKDKSRHVK